MDIFKPALFILFGTTGDLAKKKLFPALYELYTSGWLDPRTRILGIGRRDWTDEYFDEVVLTAVRASQPVTGTAITEFLKLFSYYRLDIKDNTAYPALWQTVDKMESEIGFDGNRIFFLSTAPDLFPVVAEQIGVGQTHRDGSFRRLMIEKPFGQDLDSAKLFNERLRQHFSEQEIYRIDHYLGKEMLQNILVLRFANQLFESAWQRDSIDHIQITVSEKIGIETRGGYYDQSGALRDMVQNHILQLLALLTMEKPKSFDSEGIRDAKVTLFKSLRLFSENDIDSAVVLGQYDSGHGGAAAYLD